MDEERFEFGPDEITLDVVLGLILMSIHRIVRGDAGPDHAERVLERVLAILGVAKDEARTLATEAVTDQRRITNSQPGPVDGGPTPATQAGASPHAVHLSSMRMDRPEHDAEPAATSDRSSHVAWSLAAKARFAWAIASAFVVESLVFGAAVLPAALFWQWHFSWEIEHAWLRVVLLAMAFLPAYLLFAAILMALSATAMRLLGWRTPADADLPIAELDWPLLDWARYGIANVVVRMLAGPVYRNTPVWVWYMRLNGARIGRRCWVNSLDITDHCLLEFGDDVVVGAGVHFSGHTVERGIVKTAHVKLGAGTTVGVNSHIEIDVETGPGCQIGSLSMVPKGARLDGHAVYVGAPARKLEPAIKPPETGP